MAARVTVSMAQVKAMSKLPSDAQLETATVPAEYGVQAGKAPPVVAREVSVRVEPHYET